MTAQPWSRARGQQATSATQRTSTHINDHDDARVGHQQHNPRDATRRARALAAAGATAAALVAWAIAQAVAGLTVRYDFGPDIHRVGPASVAAVGTLVGLAAWGCLWCWSGLLRTPAAS